MNAKMRLMSKWCRDEMEVEMIIKMRFHVDVVCTMPVKGDWSTRKYKCKVQKEYATLKISAEVTFTMNQLIPSFSLLTEEAQQRICEPHLSFQRKAVSAL